VLFATCLRRIRPMECSLNYTDTHYTMHRTAWGHWNVILESSQLKFNGGVKLRLLTYLYSGGGDVICISVRFARNNW